MGNYNLKSGVFRCENCFSIYKMIINPNFPECEVLLECKCIKIKKTIKDFLSELNNNKKYKINCFQCKKKEKKDALYCNNCSHIYCNKCIKNHQNHKYITLRNKDFYCVYHQTENFCAFCKDCEINLCQKCLEKKIHLNHDTVVFSKILLNKNERNFLKDKFDLVQEKMTFNTKFVNSIVKKLKNKNDINDLINLEKSNTNQNKLIIELIKFFEYLYDNSKLKNYNIIHNFKENINLNVNKFKNPDNKTNAENLLNNIRKYLKEDFIIINNSKIDKNDFKKKDEMEPKPNFDDEIEINYPKSMLGTNKFKLDLNEDEKIKNDKINTNKNEINKLNKFNNIKEPNKESKIISEEKINNNKNKKNELIKNNDNKIEKKNLDDNDIYHSRRKAVFVSSKILQQKIKEKEDNKIENQIEENKKENINKEKNINLDKNEIRRNNNINDNKYINYFSINRYRNKYNSVVNLMMVNSFRNKKIFEININ